MLRFRGKTGISVSLLWVIFLWKKKNIAFQFIFNEFTPLNNACQQKQNKKNEFLSNQKARQLSPLKMGKSENIGVFFILILDLVSKLPSWCFSPIQPHQKNIYIRAENKHQSISKLSTYLTNLQSFNSILKNIIFSVKTVQYCCSLEIWLRPLKVAWTGTTEQVVSSWKNWHLSHLWCLKKIPV